MKIEKVKNYNQKILAILGTLAIILIIVSILGIGGIAISELLRFNNDDDIETGILSDEKIEELQKENKREQVISYENPKLIDTLNSVYIIPVSHKNLNETENINGLLSIRKGSYESEDSRYSRRFYGSYNNLIIYNQKNEITKKLFDKRVNFNDIKVEYFNDNILLLFKVAEKDTYKDGVINLSDFKSLYLYSLTEKKLMKIENDEMDIVSYKFLNETKDLIISFGIDKNGNGKYENLNEPTIIKKYNYKTEKLIDIIGEKTNSELQKMLEGTEK
ncbi:hypothetical protein F7642_12710 [Tenacibaculum finnmarkense genomovar ulcerans]|uniref:hypothetical protein n=1 Tax=Tenacibaculum finnmarkense TaxID=2781243 RepID=UPI00187B411D|nr:hypothetical protein [Tenacibaculum finnmarkense]MBE7635184.1 hypothetical protein [Tenacibaculum finnmarkense genomovar ulcerans]MCD8431133.1 hypothetical protein [Tenacibaculum finnmarkense genomovar ulcerans]